MSRGIDYPNVDTRIPGRVIVRNLEPNEWGGTPQVVSHTYTIMEAAELYLILARTLGATPEACISYPTAGPARMLGFRNIRADGTLRREGDAE